MSDDTSGVSWYKPGPKIVKFHQSSKRVRCLIGGRGSGKTTAIAVETLGHAWRNAGSRTYILRKTEQSNQDTTGETFDRVFRESGTAYADTGTSLFKKIEGGRQFRLPSEKAVRLYNEFLKTNPTKSQLVSWLDTVGNKWCSFIIFSGVPTSSHRASRFRGFECSLLILVEADQFDKEDVEYALACLRWTSPDKSVCDEKGYIKEMGLILDTNPPGTRHWVAKWEAEEAKLPPEKQTIQFWHIRTHENAHNLPDGYVTMLEKAYAKKPAMWKRMLEGEYADAFDGSPVFWAFSQEHCYKDLAFPKGAYLVRGWDFGTTNATVFSAYWEERGVEYWWDLYEIFAEMSDTETQCRSVWQAMKEQFPWWNDRGVVAGVLDYCDPAGAARRDVGRSITVLNSYDFFPGFRRSGLQEGIALYNRLLEKRDADNRLVYRIDTNGCPKLYEGMVGGYRYPSENEPGYGSDEPGKGPAFGNFDHICFSGETLICTRRGEVPISEVRPGVDEVLTTQGFFPVKDVWASSPASKTRQYQFSNGRGFWATDDHPVWVQEKSDWVPVVDLVYHDTVVACHTRKLSMPTSMEGCTAGIQKQSATPTESILEHPQTEAIFTGMSGKPLMGRSRSDLTSTTETGTPPITISATLSVFQLPTTSQDTSPAESGRKNRSASGMKLGNLHQSGTSPQKDGHGMPSMPERSGSPENPPHERASTAERNFSLDPQKDSQSSAPTNVSLQPDGLQESTTLSRHVFGAEPRCSSVDTAGFELQGARLVSRSSLVRIGPVWALSVDGPHEFFAGGILVKNCDAARYSKVFCLRLLQQEMQDIKGPVGMLNRPSKPNRKRRWI